VDHKRRHERQWLGRAGARWQPRELLCGQALQLVERLRAEQREIHLVGAVVLAVKVEQRRACAAAAVAQRRAVAREEA